MSVVKIAEKPSTTKKLKMLEPVTLLMASALLPEKEAETDTANSGRLVPIATTVSPMIIGGTRSFLAIAALLLALG